MFGCMQQVDLVVCEDADDAEAKGYKYSLPDMKAVEVKKVVVVKHGTEAGKPTMDFLMEDADGNKTVFMITGKLLQLIAVAGEVL